MAQEFYTIITKIGQEKLVSATTGQKLEFYQFAVGDGNGRYYEPMVSQYALVNEKYRANTNATTIEENRIIIECLIPAHIGGFTIREIGIFDKQGSLVLVGKYPQTEKPVDSFGGLKDLYIKVQLEVDNPETIAMTVDPNVVIVTKQNLNQELSKYLKKSETVNDLNSSDKNRPLSAAQGKRLNENKLDKKEIYRKLQWTTYPEFLQRLGEYGGLKVLAGEAYLFATDENLYHLVAGSGSYNEYQFSVVPKIGDQERDMHPMHFTKPQYYLAVVDEANPRKIVLHILTSAGAEVINSLSSESTDKALSAAMGKWLNENKLGKNDKAGDSDKLDGHDSTYFATSADVQTAQRAANQGVNAAAAAHGRANEAYSRAEQAFTSASNGKIKIANAITGKGVPTSTTASWQEMAGNIEKIKTPKVLFNELVNRIKVYSLGDVCTKCQVSASIRELNGLEYTRLNGGTFFVGKKHELYIRVLNYASERNLLIIDLGEFDISSYSKLSLPILPQGSSIASFVSKNEIFRLDSFTRKQYESAVALKQVESYYYTPVRQGIDAFVVPLVYYEFLQDITEYHYMGYGHWFLVASFDKSDYTIRSSITLS